MTQTKIDHIHIADRLNDLARKAAVIAVAVIGLREVEGDEARSGLAEIVWEMRDALRELSDTVLSDARKAVAS